MTRHYGAEATNALLPGKASKHQVTSNRTPNRHRLELKSVEDTSWLQLFIKNTALCKHESGRIRCDACPVPEG